MFCKRFKSKNLLITNYILQLIISTFFSSSISTAVVLFAWHHLSEHSTNMSVRLCVSASWVAHCVTAGLQGRSRQWTSTRPSLASPPATSCPTHTWALWRRTTERHWRAADPDGESGLNCWSDCSSQRADVTADLLLITQGLRSLFCYRFVFVFWTAAIKALYCNLRVLLCG